MDHDRWMRRAVDLARRSPRSTTAFAVGAVLVDDAGREITHGYSRDDDPNVHAEESALLRAAGDPRLRAATLAARVPRVVIAWREPDIFVTCEGVALLTAAGIEVIDLPAFASAAREPNRHLGLSPG
jgi:diaminohydroxyphosphoribosylaminopyrimidine deaminase / 5-amino-6-(5-phosphoribosylamino)uracil reductase